VEDATAVLDFSQKRYLIVTYCLEQTLHWELKRPKHVFFG